MSESDSLPADLKVMRHARARRLKLRLDRVSGAPVLVLPPGVSLRQGHDFVRDHLDWIAERRDARPAGQPFADGISFPFQDRRLTIRHQPGSRSAVRLQGGDLLVSGQLPHLNRRVTDWLKVEARSVLTASARAHASSLGKSVASIRIADQKSRWGSCSSRAVLSFNWRLILAPSSVLDYVAAHEAAHLAEMNHGPAFHALVDRLCPDAPTSEEWLKQHGPSLRRWGQAAE